MTLLNMLSYYSLPDTSFSMQEILKVRGFQVAPAELEGHLLKHPAVSDTCVVGVPDEYSGEVPLAFVVLHSEVAKRVAASPVEAQKVKEDIVKVCSPLRALCHQTCLCDTDVNGH